MAERSMAVVLENGRIGYDVAVIFAALLGPEHLGNLATILAF
jgi:hypothetical protein